MIRPITISLSPNTERDDIKLAFKMLFQPWRWKRGENIEELEGEFSRYLGLEHAVSFNSGRSSFMAILRALGLELGDEVLLQAFTCNAVPNPVLWEGLTPVYVECREDDYNMNADDLEKKITAKSRAVVVQHTFGMPADMDRIQEVCARRNLVLIEDCAHALGAKYKGKLVGTFGKASFFSFSRDKVISSVYGGMAATNDKELAAGMRSFREEAGYPSFSWIFQQLRHVPLMNLIILPTYGILGKYLLVLFQWSQVFSKAIHWSEKRGARPSYFPKALPNALAALAQLQFRKLERFNAHRRKLAAFYRNELRGTEYVLPEKFEEREPVFLRFAVKHGRAHEILRNAWAKNLLLGDWYTSPIAPSDTKTEKVGYKEGTCPAAEWLSRITLNLPTHIRITEKEARKVAAFLQTHERA